MVDEAHTLWRGVIELTLYVDDLTVEAHGGARDTRVVLAGATDNVVDHMEKRLGLEVSLKKSVAVAGRLALAQAIARTGRTRKLRPSLRPS